MNESYGEEEAMQANPFKVDPNWPIGMIKEQRVEMARNAEQVLRVPMKETLRVLK